ncbi:LexA family protein [Methylobacterium radiotolerans]|uniref:LexA family protein n=1 Tax=Methylobacterium radiotolerans TaxID=31998 RepID=UPI001F2B51DF|nr:hypothetical protein LZ599_10695 [Methylobacterium radiotolerans]
MSAIGLTPIQQRLLDFITAEVEAGRPPPTFDEMKAHMGLRSKSGIHRVISALEERGRVRRLHNRARAIALTSGVGAPVAPPPAPSVDDRPRLGIPRPVAEQLAAYCQRRRLAARDVLAAALMAYMDRHQ